MNLVPSLVESYMYADMFNGSSSDKTFVGGAPIEHILPTGDYLSFSVKESSNPSVQSGVQEGGRGGLLANKVIPAGLVVIQIPINPDVKYELDDLPQENNVIADSLFDILMGSVLKTTNNKRRTPPKHKKSRRKMSKRKST